MSYDDWKATDLRDALEEMTWRAQTCSYCNDRSDDDVPCSDACASMAVRASRQRRVIGLLEAIDKAQKLVVRYANEGGPSDVRIGPVWEQIRTWERMIADAAIAQEEDDAASADTLPAAALTERDLDTVVAVVLAEDIAALERAS